MKKNQTKKLTNKNKTDFFSRNKKSLDSFTKYCNAYPEQRFFQALRNWFGVGYIGMSGDLKKWRDTFYLEEGEDYKINEK